MTKIVTHPAVQAKVKEDRCPKCDGELDTGWECSSCGFDALPLVQVASALGFGGPDSQSVC